MSKRYISLEEIRRAKANQHQARINSVYDKIDANTPENNRRMARVGARVFEKAAAESASATAETTPEVPATPTTRVTQAEGLGKLVAAISVKPVAETGVTTSTEQTEVTPAEPSINDEPTTEIDTGSAAEVDSHYDELAKLIAAQGADAKADGITIRTSTRNDYPAIGLQQFSSDGADQLGRGIGATNSTPEELANLEFSKPSNRSSMGGRAKAEFDYDGATPDDDRGDYPDGFSITNRPR